MNILCFDVETTGLAEHMLRDPEARIHCLMGQELEWNEETSGLNRGRLVEFYDAPLPHTGDEWEYMGGIDRIPAYLAGMSALCGLNIIEYDLPILAHHLNYDHRHQQLVDGLIISRKNWPDRPGGHSVEAWGYRLGRPKPQQEDWSEMTVDVRHRCREDTIIEVDILEFVLREMMEGIRKCQIN